DRGLLSSCDELEKSISNEIEKNGILSQNIFLLGFSQGASVALSMALVSQHKLGGIISLAGFLPYHKVLLRHEKENNKTTPILMLHGEDDQVVPRAVGEESYKGLRENDYQVEFKVCGMAWFFGDETVDFFKEILEKKGITRITSASSESRPITIEKINNAAPFNRKV
ncbi:2938_t:CDS:2, partial [Racocetra fulgida]